MKIKPLHDWAVIKPKEDADRSPGGIIIPESAKGQSEEGEVLAIGEGRFKEKRDKKGDVTEKKFVKTTVKPGDHVLYEKYGTSKITVDGKEVVMVREDDILGWMK